MNGKCKNPRIEELMDQYRKGRMTRREFIRYAALLGVSVSAASSFVGLTGPRPLEAAVINRGGTLKVSGSVQKIAHPATFSWAIASNQIRQVAEYLTFTDSDNITHPYLAEKWEVSKDLKTWTLYLRKGIKFNNGDEFSADDVIFTIKQWLSKDVGSSMLGLMGAYLPVTGIEKVDAHQVKLHLDKAEIAVPEHLFHYPAFILNHKTFEGDFIKAPHGTGPFTVELYRAGERFIFTRRNDYWQKGPDGQPLPYLDRIEYLDMGMEMAPQITAIKSGEIDVIDLSTAGGTDVYQILKGDPNTQVLPIATAQTRVLGMRSDSKPWSDNKLRLAMRLCQNREKILSLAYFGEGLLGQDFHVYPKHPEYCPKPTPKFDPEKARQLLKEAGYPNGLDVELNVNVSLADTVRYAEILKQDAAPAGFRIHIKTMPSSQYWEKWTEFGFKITSWTHRPLGTMVLNLAYTADATGKPVPWNETKWVDQEFSTLLAQANATIDLEERRKIFCKLEDIQLERGSIGIAYWRNVWYVARKEIQGVEPHPTSYLFLTKVWMKK